MGRTIDLDLAVNALQQEMKLHPCGSGEWFVLSSCLGKLVDLPSAQPEPCEDAVSRQAAIDALCSVCGVDCDKSEFVYDGKQEDQIILCPEHYALTQLPSVQPEIVRCKDCKHYGCILYSGTQFEYGECFGHEESQYTFEVKPDDFCSRAERRTYERTD